MLRRGAPGALAATKELLRRERPAALGDQFAEMLQLSARFFAAPEAQEGMAAFAAKRPPSWAHRSDRPWTPAQTPPETRRRERHAAGLAWLRVVLLAGPFERAVDVLAGRPLVALTGAGLSTDSGIPDYRGPGAPRRTPMTYQELLSGPAAQRRYWARSHVGWARMARAEPNAGHRALAELERAGVLRGLITQNVDGLHTAAGSRAVIDLHGRIADVVCVGCRPPLAPGRRCRTGSAR